MLEFKLLFRLFFFQFDTRKKNSAPQILSSQGSANSNPIRNNNNLSLNKRLESSSNPTKMCIKSAPYLHKKKVIINLFLFFGANVAY